jgi:NAD(P)-dependent dehydrogenase (short-subunit alcohol dehydrogenase family)
MRLKDRVAIVTGGGFGIGKAYSLGFAHEGAKVVVADLNFEGAKSVAKEIEQKGKEALAIKVDVADEQSTIEMAKKTVERFGKIDILVNNAALFTALGPGKPWNELDAAEWDKVMIVNVRGPWLCAKAVFPYMKSQGKGKIINISSGVAFKGALPRMHYAVSKAAVLCFTKTLAQAVGQYNINVNTLAPGSTLSEGVVQRESDSSNVDRIKAQRCIKRAMYPEDLIGAAVFLASDESDMMSAQTVMVDGGIVML